MKLLLVSQAAKRNRSWCGRRNWCAGLGSLLAVAMLSTSLTAAAAYPDKPIRLVVPFPPGGAVDFYARVVQPALTEVLGQPVVIENKAGASGMVGAALVAQAPADGHTLLIGNIASMAINVGIYAKMPYDPRKDLTHIVRTVDVNYVMAVHPSVPARTVQEFIAYTKTQGGKVSYGSAGNGSLPHLATELFKSLTGTQMIHVPYKGGGPMVSDILGGQIQLVIADQANLMPHVQSGRLRALAVATAKRSPNAPDIPTIGETLPGFEATAWQGLVGPAGLPPDITRRINEAFNQVMAMPAVRDKLLAAGLAPVGGTPEQFSRFIDSEINKWTKIAKDVGASAD